MISLTVVVCVIVVVVSLQGFCTLICKDWLNFGHQFQVRIGHADDHSSSSERSPVFLQVRCLPSCDRHAVCTCAPLTVCITRALSLPPLCVCVCVLQFLDCVWQLVHQYPNAFEFSTRLPLFLAHHLFSCRFGDFLFNCQRERQAAKLAGRTPSIFGFILNKPDSYRNKSFVPVRALCAGLMVVHPPCYSHTTPSLSLAPAVLAGCCAERGCLPAA